MLGLQHDDCVTITRAYDVAILQTLGIWRANPPLGVQPNLYDQGTVL